MNAQQQAEINRLNSVIPNPYDPNAWYPSELNGQPVEVKRVKNGAFLHIRKQGFQVVRTYDTNEVIDRRPTWIKFSVNMKTYDMKAI